MSNTGKDLEYLVRTIEENLLPAGFKVSSNERISDDNGNQIAEFDIILTGNLGSSSVNWLIECRDRPSSGPAPGAWIEQLVGRRQRFGFDKVFAVSTTGFSVGAIEYAEQSGIILRTVENVQAISDDFGTIDFRMRRRNITIGGYVDFSLLKPTQKEKEQALEFMSKPGRIAIKLPLEHDFYNLEQFILYRLRDKPGYTGPEDDSVWKITFFYEGPVELRFNELQKFLCVDLKIPIDVQFEYFFAPAMAGKLYSEEGKSFGQEVECLFDAGKLYIRCRSLILKDADGNVDVKSLYEHEFIEKDTEIQMKPD